jgi:hypothetical protein
MPIDCKFAKRVESGKVLVVWDIRVKRLVSVEVSINIYQIWVPCPMHWCHCNLPSQKERLSTVPFVINDVHKMAVCKHSVNLLLFITVCSRHYPVRLTAGQIILILASPSAICQYLACAKLHRNCKQCILCCLNKIAWKPFSRNDIMQ